MTAWYGMTQFEFDPDRDLNDHEKGGERGIGIDVFDGTFKVSKSYEEG
jgi:hypothetical protein